MSHRNDIEINFRKFGPDKYKHFMRCIPLKFIRNVTKNLKSLKHINKIFITQKMCHTGKHYAKMIVKILICQPTF